MSWSSRFLPVPHLPADRRVEMKNFFFVLNDEIIDYQLVAAFFRANEFC